MCVHRQQMPVWLRLNYLALILLMTSRVAVNRGTWRMSFDVAGALVLVVAIALMLAERRRGGNQGVR